MRLTAPLEPWHERYRREFFRDLSLAEAVAEVLPAEECFFFEASAGVVLGLRLMDGSRVAFKAVRPRPGLREAVTVQQALHRSGFPCPRPLSGPHALSSGSFAVVQEWVEAPQRDLHDPARRSATAVLLAELVETAPRLEALPPTFAGPRTPFPPPHDSRFDFARADGAWIDDAAEVALGVLSRPVPEVVAGHSDWSAKHFGWDGDRIRVVYDWPDSIARDAEATIVGQASVVFPSTWDLPVEPKLATPDESAAFVEEYEEAVGRRLDRERVAAAQTYVTAYCARCELSDRGAGGDFQERLRASL